MTSPQPEEAPEAPPSALCVEFCGLERQEHAHVHLPLLPVASAELRPGSISGGRGPSSSVASLTPIMVQTRSRTRVALALLPPDVIAHILTMPCLTIEDLVMVDRVSKLFAFAPKPSSGRPSGHSHSIIESALRLRRAVQTGVAVKAEIPREDWWQWPNLKCKLFHDELCRRGVRLVPKLPATSGPDVRRGVIFFHGAGPPGSPPDEIVLGRMTRAFDNRQGISDPRVSRQHLRISLLNDFAPAQPAGVARVLGLGHNPSTIRRANPSAHSGEQPSFKLRRGDTATLYPGDTIHLVCEDVSRAHGRSLPFEGNSCEYEIDVIPENCDLSPPQVVYGREVEKSETDSDSSESASQQQPQQQQQQPQPA